jgi:predicted  nucleic acid-binding Zn-ribbon protein
MIDPATISVITAGLGAIFGIACTKGIDAYLKYRADKREDVKLLDVREDQERDKEDNTLRFIIGRQDARIEKLENELREIHGQHNECEKKYAALSARLDRTERDVASVTKEVGEHK